MSFNESAACLSIGIGMAVFMWLAAKGKFGEEAGNDAEDLIFTFALVTALIGGCAWCLIVGLHWIIKTW